MKKINASRLPTEASKSAFWTNMKSPDACQPLEAPIKCSRSTTTVDISIYIWLQARYWYKGNWTIIINIHMYTYIYIYIHMYTYICMYTCGQWNVPALLFIEIIYHDIPKFWHVTMHDPGPASRHRRGLRTHQRQAVGPRTQKGSMDGDP